MNARSGRPGLAPTLALIAALFAGAAAGLCAEADRERPAGDARGRPDFVIADVALTPPAPAGGEDIAVTVTVRNRGTAAGSAGTVAVWAQGPSARRRTLPADASAEVAELAAGESIAVTLGPVKAPRPGGTYALRVAVDARSATRESNERNNQKLVRYTVRDPATDQGPPTVTFTGTVVHKRFEGGFFAIEADTGQKYDPLNLPDEYATDGLRVWVSARVRSDVATFHMYGTLIEITEIRRAEAGTRTGRAGADEGAVEQ
jgi:hypothetical protein